MASAFTHGFVALALGSIWPAHPKPWRFWALAVGSSILPDCDVIGFALGIQYGDLLGHRGFTHSLLFALLWSVAVMSFEFRELPKLSKPWSNLLAFFVVVTASHGVLDALTNGGLGVAFFSPFVPTRYFFDWHPVQVSPISAAGFFSRWGGSVLLSEFKYIWLPMSFLWIGACLWKRHFRFRHDRGLHS